MGNLKQNPKQVKDNRLKQLKHLDKIQDLAAVMLSGAHQPFP